MSLVFNSFDSPATFRGTGLHTPQRADLRRGSRASFRICAIPNAGNAKRDMAPARRAEGRSVKIVPWFQHRISLSKLGISIMRTSFVIKGAPAAAAAAVPLLYPGRVGRCRPAQPRPPGRDRARGLPDHDPEDSLSSGSVPLVLQHARAHLGGHGRPGAVAPAAAVVGNGTQAVAGTGGDQPTAWNGCDRQQQRQRDAEPHGGRRAQ